ncbi:thioredoxin family protein [Limibaculum sp. M0105]|uniref:Thioredoxin family protein n=1 Tax=Thermohalobaculum xanthum TaxID=2753746 RepID=A0A8J7SF32_9RHOB|nr:thioredoxin family protein [Thermohalobaculum xanthum]MBK0399886.1 thioredoxin family protein [Thermohalobaculum xanthum]
MATGTPICDFGWKAPDFSLPGIDGKNYSRASLTGPRGLLVMFLCNHCPYVRAVETRIARDARDLAPLGIGVAAICSNDAAAYPDDGPDGLREQAARAGFGFAYLIDAEQAVARAYGAVCTPEFFGFDAGLGLQYRGRLDASRREAGPDDLRRDLFLAMKQVAETGQGPREQIASVGCSIKWK